MKKNSIKCSNSGTNEYSPQTKSNVSWISSKVELVIWFLNSDVEISLRGSDLKIGPATGVT